MEKRQKFAWWAMVVSLTISTTITTLSGKTEKAGKGDVSLDLLQDSLTTKVSQVRRSMAITTWMAMNKQRRLLQAMQQKDSMETGDIQTIKEIDRQLNQLLYEH